MILNSQLVEIWKEAAVTYLKEGHRNYHSMRISGITTENGTGHCSSQIDV
jgi:hypothetical protein